MKFLYDRTFTLNELIDHLPKIVHLKEKSITIRGLSIAKVFRNKEGHTVTPSHAFDATNYEDVSCALTALYRDAFGQTLSVNFSLVRNEPAVWKLSPRNPPIERTASCKPVSAVHAEPRASSEMAMQKRARSAPGQVASPADERPIR